MSIAPATAAGAGSGGKTGTGPATGTASVSAISMSSGSAMTTGPGRPVVAVVQARDRISGRRETSSISVTHLAMVPKTAR